MDSGEETRGMQVVRSGLSLRDKEDGPTFWEDFINVCSDADGMATLLGVKRESVTTWAQRIRDVIEKVEKHDQQSPDKEEEKEELIPTGDNGAMTDKTMGRFGPKGGL